MKKYFKGNTTARDKRIAKIHKKFKQHQTRWILKKFAKNFLFEK